MEATLFQHFDGLSVVLIAALVLLALLARYAYGRASRASSAARFGGASDTNLYRTAATRLRTDGGLDATWDGAFAGRRAFRLWPEATAFERRVGRPRRQLEGTVVEG